MAHFLFTVDLPDALGERQADESSRIARFEQLVKELQMPTASSKQLSRSAWLLDAKNSWPLLAGLAGAADTCRFPYSVHLIEGDVTPLSDVPAKFVF